MGRGQRTGSAPARRCVGIASLALVRLHALVIVWTRLERCCLSEPGVYMVFHCCLLLDLRTDMMDSHVEVSDQTRNIAVDHVCCYASIPFVNLDPNYLAKSGSKKNMRMIRSGTCSPRNLCY
jgi:hypothetical protein